MKINSKNKKKLIFSLSTTIAALSITSIIVAACSQNKNNPPPVLPNPKPQPEPTPEPKQPDPVEPETPSKQLEFKVSAINFKDQTPTSTTIEVSFNELKPDSKNEFYLHINDSQAPNLKSSKFDVINKKVEFQLTNLKANSIYRITKLTYLNKEEIDISHISNKSYNTSNPGGNEKVDDFVIQNVEFSNISQNAAKVRLNFTKHQLKDNNLKNFELKFSNSKNFTNSSYNIGSNFLEFQLDNLNTNTTYDLLNVKLNNNDLNISNLSNKSFKTLALENNNNNQPNPNPPSTPQPPVIKNKLTSLVFLNTTFSSTTADLSIDKTINNSSKIIVELVDNSTNQTSRFSEFSLIQNKARFNLTSLKPQTTYRVSKVILDNEDLELPTNLNYNFTTQQQPTQPQRQDDFTISSLRAFDITNNEAKVEVNFNKHTLGDANFKSFKLDLKTLGTNATNIVSFTTTNYNTNDTKVIFNLTNLRANTSFEVASVSLNNNSLTLPSQKTTFSTTNIAPQTSSSLNTTKTHRSANLSFNFNQQLPPNAVLVLGYSKDSEPNNIISKGGNAISTSTASFDLTNLTPSTPYTIRSLTINGLDVNLNNIANKQFTTNVQPVDNFVVSSIETSNIKNTQATVKVNFSTHTLADEQNKNFVLSVGDLTFRSSSYSLNDNYIYFYLNGLTRNQQYTINSLRVNDLDVSLASVSNKTFSTTDNEQEVQREAMPSSEFNKTQDYFSARTRNKYYDQPQNIQQANYEIQLTDVYKQYLNSNTKVEYANENLDQFTKVPRVLSGSFNSGFTTLDIKVDIPNPQNQSTYTLEYEITSQTNTKTTNTISLVADSSNPQRYTGQITTTVGDAVKILNLKNNSVNVDDFSKTQNTYFETQIIGDKSDKFRFNHFGNWQLISDGTLDNRWKFDPQIFTKDGSSNYPTFHWKYVKPDGTVAFVQFNQRNNTNQIIARVDKKDFARPLGIFYEEGGKKYNVIDASLQEPRFPSKNGTQANAAIDINSISVSNNTITVNFSRNLANNSDLKVLVKSTNPNQPWSKLITLSNISNSSASFSSSLLQDNIKNYIITHSLLDAKESVYTLNSKYKFTKQMDVSSITLNDFKVIGNDDTKIIYGAASFNIDNTNLKYLKDKWFEFKFEVELPDSANEDQRNAYNAAFVRYPTIYVPFEKLNKFILAGFMDRVKYTLIDVKVLEPYTKEVYLSVNKGSNNYSFVKYFSYDLYNQMYDDDKTLSTVSNTDLITTKKNLTSHDLRHISLSGETKNSIPFSIQNFYSLINYKYEMFFISSRESNKPTIKPFVMVDDNNQNVVLKSLVGRELLINKRVNFNENHTVATIKKDLSRYKNLNQLNEEDVLFNFIFEFDPTHKVLTDFGISAGTKTYVMVPVSYKKIKQGTVEETPFNVIHGFDNFITQNLYHKVINSMFKFKTSLEGDILKLDIIAKDEQNTRIFDFKPDHNLSLFNSAFIGTHQFYMFWKDKSNVEITFEEKPYENNEITDKTEISTYRDVSKFEDGYGFSVDAWDSEKLFSLYSKLEKPKETAKRIFADSKQKAIEDLRKRSFSFQSRGGTWTMLGKVKPEDDEDHRYYVTTNQHVLDGNNRRDGTSQTNPWVTRKMENVDIKIPVVTTKEEHQQNPRNPIVDSSNLNFGRIDIDIEPINNFFNEYIFPTQDEFKDNQGENPVGVKSKTADVIYAIADFKFFFNNFRINDKDNWRFNGRVLNDTEKKVVEYIHNWRNLELVKQSNQTLGLDDYVSLNAYIATFPAVVSNNPDSPEWNGRNSGTSSNTQIVKRYREYVLGSSIKPLDTVFYLGGTNGGITAFNNPTVNFDANTIDGGGGSSGTALFDNEGGLLGYFVSADNPDPRIDIKGAYQMFVIDLHRNSFYGNGTTPLANSSFYERMRLLSYYYPEWFSQKYFKNKPKFY